MFPLMWNPNINNFRRVSVSLSTHPLCLSGFARFPSPAHARRGWYEAITQMTTVATGAPRSGNVDLCSASGPSRRQRNLDDHADEVDPLTQQMRQLPTIGA